MTWWTDYQARRGKDRKTLYTDNMKNLILTEFENSTSYNFVKINGFDRKTRIVEESSIIKNPNRKRLLCLPDETISIGDIVYFDNSNWICVMGDITSKILDIGIIQKTNNTLKFYNQSSILCEEPCIIGKGNLSLDTSTYLSLPADEYIITVPNNLDTSNIKEDTRFILNKNAYVVLGIDDISTVGLLNIRVKQDVISENDNLELGVADYYSNQHVYTVTIQNSDVTKYVDDTITLSVLVTNDGQQVISPTLSYSSSDESVAIVENGVITCLAIGTAIISVTYNGISDSITITVQEEKIGDNYTVDITGATTVKLNSNITLIASVFNNGVVDSSKSVVWSISNQDLSSNVYVTIVSQDGTSIVLKATSNSAYVNKYINIKASKNDDSLVFDNHIIQIKSLF